MAHVPHCGMDSVGLHSEGLDSVRLHSAGLNSVGLNSVRLRELEQNPSVGVARAEHGETIVITVQGRPVAKMVQLEPARPRRWVPSEEIDRIFADIGPDTTCARPQHRHHARGPRIHTWGCAPHPQR